MHDPVADFYLHRGFGARLIVAFRFDVDPVGEAFELGPIQAGRLLHQQVERSLGGFKLVPLVFQVLHASENCSHQRLVLWRAGLR